MMSLTRKIQSSSLFASSTTRNLSYLMTAEGVSRVARIALTVVMARLLSVSDFGVLAVALTVHELVAVLAQNGFGLTLMRQSEAKVEAAANTAYLLSFGWAGAMCGVQLVVAWLMALWGFDQSSALLQALAPVHLLLPFALTHVHMIHRGGKLGSFATVGTLQGVGDCAATLVLLLLGMGLWAIVIARFVSTLIWVVGFRRVDCWSYAQEKGYVPAKQLFTHTIPVLLSEYSKSVRQWGDNLIVGAVLGTELLGLYYFAKNSGLGISLSLSQISVATVTPRLAQLTREQSVDRQVQRKRLVVKFSLFLTVLIGAQALLAPIYVPILFGSAWEPAVLLLSLLCVSAIPRCIADLHACLARNSGLTALEMRWNSGYTVAFLSVVVLVASFGLEAMASALIVLNVVMALVIVAFTWQRLAREEISFSSANAQV